MPEETTAPVLPRIPDTFSEIFPNGIGPDATYSLVIAFCAVADEIRAMQQTRQVITPAEPIGYGTYMPTDAPHFPLPNRSKKEPQE